MSLSLRAQTACLCCSLVLGIPAILYAEGTYQTNGTEYAIAGLKQGDQVHPAVALNSKGGFLAWEDNIASPAGLSVSAVRLDANFSPMMSSFKINSATNDSHERVQVALLNDGGAVFVWQGGRYGFQHIFARFLSSSNTWLSGDIQVNSSTNFFQINPVVATLNNGNVVVTWSSFGQYDANSMQDVYCQLFSPTGQKLGSELLVNQFTAYNQRTPTVAALSTGGFVIAWVSEQQRLIGNNPPQLAPTSQLARSSVDIYARLFLPSGQASGNEFLVNTSSNICANPSITGGSGGGFVLAWGERDDQVPSNSWDVYARSFSSAAVGGPVNRINTETYGDQFGPRVNSSGTDYLMVWSSLGQDGSMEGVYGQFLHADGTTNGPELRVNTTWLSKQIHPAVASDAQGRFLVTWTSFNGSMGFDIFAQRYASIAPTLQAMAAPFTHVPLITSNGIYQPQIVVSWPAQTGLAIDHYEVYADGALAASPTTNTWTMTAADGLTASSTHSFQISAVVLGGVRSPLSPASTATTWSGYNWGGIPFEWMSEFYGMDSSKWPPPNGALAQGAPTLYQVFLTGGTPFDSSTWLRTSLQVNHVQGQAVYLLHWNTQPGLVYQVQTSSDMNSWADFQAPRLASDSVDSVQVPKNNLQYYRIVRLR